MIDQKNKFARSAVWLPVKIYELALRFRVAAYETSYLKPKTLGASVISVGNITVGGTGKTPLVEYIARYLAEEDFSVAILTRGYKRRSRGMKTLNLREVSPASSGNSPGDLVSNGEARSEAIDYLDYGDEPTMLAQALPEVPIIVNRNRFEGGRLAERVAGSDVLIMDDGYQHMQLARDLNLLVIDATNPFGDFEIFPLGGLREPLYGLKRADAVIVTRANRAFDQSQLITILKHACGDKIPVMYFYSEITRLRHLGSGIVYDARQFRGWNSALLCGVGNPEAFAEDVLDAGISIIGKNFFADHHAYTQEDLDRVSNKSRADGAEIIITTKKDAVKLGRLKESHAPIYAAETEINSEDEVRFKSLLLRRVGKQTRS